MIYMSYNVCYQYFSCNLLFAQAELKLWLKTKQISL